MSAGQVRELVDVLRKTRAEQDKQAEKMQAMTDEMKAREEAGESLRPSDLAKLYQGVGVAMSANNAEMEIVKTAGANWAEHQWVKQQLRTARLQQGEGSEALEHNFELYRQYEEDLGDFY